MWSHGFYYDKVDNQTKMSSKGSHQGEDPLENECRGTLVLDQTKKKLIAPLFPHLFNFLYSTVYKPEQPCLY